MLACRDWKESVVSPGGTTGGRAEPGTNSGNVRQGFLLTRPKKEARFPGYRVEDAAGGDPLRLVRVGAPRRGSGDDEATIDEAGLAGR